VKNIVIVDDSSSARMFIQRCFEVSGFEGANFIEANNGKEAVSVLESQSVDLVVTDLTMPEMDGTELLKWIKGNAKFAKTPVVVITSSGNEAKKQELVDIGAFSVLTKPISPAIIAKTITPINK